MLGQKRTLRSTPSLPEFCQGVARATEGELRAMPPWDGGSDGFDPFDNRGRRKRADARRALFGSVAGVAMLVVPLALANSIIPEKDSGGVSTDQASATSVVALRAEQTAKQADAVQARS